MPPTANIKEALAAVKIRYPGKPEPVPLSDLVTEKRLTDLLKHQYESVHQPGTVQFIPEVRGRFRNSSEIWIMQERGEEYRTLIL